MFPVTRGLLARLLKGYWFRCGVDFGCGEGLYSRVLLRHVGFLVGVDHNRFRLGLAKLRGYDLVFHAKIESFVDRLPKVLPQTSLALFLDSLEHLPKGVGIQVLGKLGWIPYQIVTTPKFWHEWTFRNKHQSLWTQAELEGLGFKTITYKYLGPLGNLLNRNRREILAWKGFRGLG